MTNCNTLNPYTINPLFCSDWSDTATNCAAALDALLALDGSRLTDRARAAGLAMLLEPIIGALDGAVELEGGCITLTADETERLRALADAHHHGSVRAALDVALDLAEAKAVEPKPEPTREEMAAIWRRIADQADAELEKLAETDQGEADTPPPLTVDLPDHEAAILARIAEKEGCDLSRTATSLLGGAIRRHATTVGGAA